MSDLSTLSSLIGQQINDPNNKEVGTGAGSLMVDWINRILDDTAKLTDCLQHKVKITGTGSLESFPLPTGGISYLTVLLFGTAETENTAITITIDGTATTLTEDSEWQAGASNTEAAASLASALNGVTGVSASSSGAVITVIVDDGTSIDLLTSSSAQTVIKIDNSAVWRIINVVDRTNNRIYLPISRRDYQAAYLSIQGFQVSVEYYYNIFGFGSDRDIYILPIVTNNLVIDMDVSTSHLKMVYVDGTETPLGLLNEYDALVIAGVSAIYYGTNGDETRGQFEFQK